MASTATKLVGGVSSDDANDFAKEMHTTADIIQSLQKTDTMTYFAFYVRNKMKQVEALDVPLGHLERLPRATDAEVEALRALNRERYCALVEKARLSVTSQKAPTFELEEPKVL